MAGKLKWMEPWLKLPFYKERCAYPKHQKQYTTFYCTVCMQTPMCKLCWENNSNQHQNHKVLKVYIASGRTAITAAEISKFVDVSCIKKYSINGSQIVYLNRCEKEKKKEDSNSDHKCQVCHENLNEPGHKFCSIACKVSTLNKKAAVEPELTIVEKNYAKRKKIECDMQIMKKDDPESQANECGSFRKRSRKGIPHRAPFE